MNRIPWPLILALLAVLALLPALSRWAEEADAAGSVLALALAFLFPAGLALVAASGLPADRAARAASLTTLALALATLGYLVSGFAFQFGGIAFVSQRPDLQNLSRFFSLVSGANNAHWGVVGLTGFGLSGDAITTGAIQLFVAHLPLVSAATLAVMLALPGRAGLLAQLFAGLVTSAITYPLAGHWTGGGGWLAHLGHTLALGHGVVDFGGAGSVFVVGGATALAAALVFGRNDATERPAAPSPRLAHSALLAGPGALLAAVGWIAVGLSNPLYADAAINWPRVVLHCVVGLAGGALTAQLISGFTTGRFDAVSGGRGALAGLVAVSAGAPFMPTWAALITGAVAGLLLPLAGFAVERALHLEDESAAVAGYLTPALWGLVAVAIFADGRWGQGWNGIDGPAGQGVSGLLVAPGLLSDGGQLGAQVWGGVALFLLGLLLPWGLLKLLSLLAALRRRSRIFAFTLSSASAPPGERQSASGGLDGVVNMDDGD